MSLMCIFLQSDYEECQDEKEVRKQLTGVGVLCFLTDEGIFPS